MDQADEVKLLKKNLQKVEEKFISFFQAGNVRWPGEPHDLLRNHYKHFDNISMKMMTLERLGLNDLPEEILKEVELAFEAFQKREEYK